MVLSRRERYIAIATISVLAILILDRFILSPMFERKAAFETEKLATIEKLSLAEELFARKKSLLERWQNMREAGLALERSEAESHVLQEIRDWSRASGLSVTSVRPERTVKVEEIEELEQILFQATGTGTLKAISQFLYRVETSPSPIRMTQFQLGTRKEGTDDLTIQFQLSALCQAAIDENGGKSDD